MEWGRLRVFVAVADHGSVGAAAAALHITGPAVTQQIRKLERETGHRLVEPDGRGIRLTAAGHVLAGYAAAVATSVADATRDLAALRDDAVGPLRIGSVASALRALLPHALPALAADHPRLVPTVRDGEVVDMLPALRARDLDAVLLESWTHLPVRIPPGVRVTTLVTEPVLLAVPSGHRIADRDPAPLGELAGEVWSAGPIGTEPYEALVQLMRAHDVEPDIRYVFADFSTQLALVQGGLAVAIVPGIAAVPPPDGVRFLTFEPAIGRSLLLAVREQDADLPASRALAAAVRTATAHAIAAAPDPGPVSSRGAQARSSRTIGITRDPYSSTARIRADTGCGPTV